MKKFSSKKISTFFAVFFLSTLILIPFPASAEENRLIIKDDSGGTSLALSNEGMVAFNQGETSSSLMVSRPSTPGRMDVGFGGTGGGNMEFYSKGSLTYPERQGQFKFIYGGGVTMGSLIFTHFDGASTWTDMMILSDSGRMTMSGGAYCDGQHWVDASSRELKENIEDLSTEDALKTLQALKPVSFNYKTDPDDPCIGFIAEDVPALVATKDRKGTSAMDFAAVLTKVVQHQQREIDILKEEIKALRQN